MTNNFVINIQSRIPHELNTMMATNIPTLCHKQATAYGNKVQLQQNPTQNTPVITMGEHMLLH